MNDRDGTHRSQEPSAAPAGRTLTRGTFFCVEDAILDLIPQIGTTAFAVYSVLAKYASATDQTCYPSLKTIIGHVGGRRQYVLRAIKTLEERGVIAITRRKKSNGANTSNLYTLLSVPPNTLVSYGNQGGCVTGTRGSVIREPGGGITGEPVCRTRRNRTKPNEPNPIEERAPAEPVPPQLLSLVDAWNELQDLGLVKARARRDPPSKSVLDAWKRLKREPELRDAISDQPRLFNAIRKATFCHGEGWFTLAKLFGKNKDRELIAVKLINGGYDDQNSRSSKRSTSKVGAGQRYDPSTAGKRATI